MFPVFYSQAALATGDVHGKFELQLSSFTNDQAVDSNGQCCNGVGSIGQCTTPCETFFRICLLQYMRDIPTDQVTCTYGSIITPVLGDNTFPIPIGPKPEENFVNPLRFDFMFDWPVSVILVTFYTMLLLHSLLMDFILVEWSLPDFI